MSDFTPALLQPPYIQTYKNKRQYPLPFKTKVDIYMLNFFLKKKTNEKAVVTVVTGIPRSGTSMMMQMLEAGGVSVVTDCVRTPDRSNQKGYFEHEKAKALSKGDTSCLADANGKAIKVISNLLKFLPNDREYKVIFMNRKLESIMASQEKMLDALGKGSDANNDDELAKLYRQHNNSIKTWLNSQSNIDLLELDYETILDNPKLSLDTLAGFLPHPLDFEAMKLAIDTQMNHHT